MNSKAEAAIDALHALHPKGFDLSLDRIRALLTKLGEPQDRIPPAFHIAGTNGKGSTAAFLRAILEAAGKSVHVHTSPHLVNWHERYRLGGNPADTADGAARLGKFVDDEVLADAIERVAVANGGSYITVFEIMSAVGFVLFSEHPADYCILEVGLGGRFDATNVIATPACAIITPVGMDHEAQLGDTLGKIAFEKAGIIKSGAPLVVGGQEDEALEVIAARAKELGVAPIVMRSDFDGYAQHGRFIYQDETGLLDLPMPALIGDHQLSNAATAIAAARLVLPELPETAFEIAMKTAVWPGRFHRLPVGRLHGALPNSNADIWVDGGHNPHAGSVLAREIQRLNALDGRETVLITGMLTTKDPSGFFAALRPCANQVITVPVPDSESGFTSAELAKIATRCGFEAVHQNTISEALAKAVALRPAARILICGSLYLIGDVLRQNGTPPS